MNIFLLDNEHNAEKTVGFRGTAVRLAVEPNSVVLISDDYE